MADRRPLFTIGSVARLLDVPPPTIRTWEARYGLIVPERSEGGQRLYSRAQIDQLRLVRDAIASGRRPAEAHRLLADRLLDEPDERPLRLLLAGRGNGAADGLRRLFDSLVFEVVHAADEETARELHRRLDPALVVVDMDDEGFHALADAFRSEGTKILPLELLERPLSLLDAAPAARNG